MNNKRPKVNKKTQRRNARLQGTKRMQNNGLPELVPIVSKCSRDYMACLTNPYRAISPLPCIPDMISLPSNKFRTRAVGNLTTNSDGIGLIGVNPFETFATDCVNSLWHSTSAYAPPSTANFAFDAVGVVLGSLTSPYSVASLSNAFTQLRLVGCGIKVRYAGTTLAQQGRIVSFRSPSNIGLQSGAVASLLNNPTTLKSSVKKRYVSVTYVPDDPDYLGYQTVAALTNSILKTCVLIHCIESAPLTSFDYEMSAYWEMIGTVTLASANYTASHSDPVGLGAAISSVPIKISSSPPEKQEQKGLWDLGNKLLSTASYVAFRGGSTLLDSLARQYLGQKESLKLPASSVQVEEVED